MAWSYDASGGPNYLFPNSTSSGSALSGAYITAITAGDVLVVHATTDNVQSTNGNSTLHTSLNDDAGNTYTKIGEYTVGGGGAGSGCTTSAWFCKLAHSVTTSNQATLNLASSVVAKAVAATRFSISPGNNVRIAGTTQYAASNTSTAGSRTVSGITSGEHLYCRVSGLEYNAISSSINTDSGWQRRNYTRTNTGAADANVTSMMEFIVATGSSPTSNADLTVTADNVSIMFALEEYAAATTYTLTANPASGNQRNFKAQPFSQSSIWNMPIGSGAVFKASNLNGNPTDPNNSTNTTYAPMPSSDPEHIIVHPEAPIVGIYTSSAGWSGTSRCSATGGLLFNAPIPNTYTVPSSNKNDSAAILMADGNTIKQCQPLALCTAGGNGTALVTFGDVTIDGDGITGSHGGSGLSGIGGAIRIGELRPGQVGPRHALKVELYCKEFLYKAPQRTPNGYSTGGTGGAYRWPATTSDSYWNNSTTGYGMGSNAVNNSNPDMCMGALLAIPSTTNINTMGLQTEPAKQLAWTLQNYGAYIVDDTASPAFSICIEDGPDGSKASEFQSDYGFAFDQRVIDNSLWVHDMQALCSALRVVSNNSPTSIGGGGTPLQPLLSDPQGGYQVTAQAATFSVTQGVAAAKGTFTLSGKTVTFSRSHTVTAAVRTFALSGVSTAFTKALNLTTAAGSFAYTGDDVAFFADTTGEAQNLTFTADAASFSLAPAVAALSPDIAQPPQGRSKAALMALFQAHHAQMQTELRGILANQPTVLDHTGKESSPFVKTAKKAKPAPKVSAPDLVAVETPEIQPIQPFAPALPMAQPEPNAHVDHHYKEALANLPLFKPK